MEWNRVTTSKTECTTHNFMNSNAFTQWMCLMCRNRRCILICSEWMDKKTTHKFHQSVNYFDQIWPKYCHPIPRITCACAVCVYQLLFYRLRVYIFIQLFVRLSVCFICLLMVFFVPSSPSCSSPPVVAGSLAHTFLTLQKSFSFK